MSVILASYNHEAYVEAAIKSVLDQTIKNLELLVIDDGSADKTLARARKIKDPRLTIIPLKHNRAVHPRNLGLEMAQGQYIAFQNSDDLWDQGKLAQQLDEFKKNQNLAVCFSRIELIGQKGQKVKRGWANNQFSTGNRPRTDWLRHLFENGNCFCISSALISGRKLESAGTFDESLVNLADFDLWVRLAAVGDIMIVEKPLTKMRILKQNFSAPSNATTRRSVMELAIVLDRYTQPPIKDSLSLAFAEIMPKATRDEIIQFACLAKYAWGGSAPHRLFADRLFARLIINHTDRKKIVDHFGVEIIHEFLKKRSQLEVLVRG